MKKLILIFGAFAIICVFINASFDNIEPNREPQALLQQASSEEGQVYVVKSENGRIVVYKDGELLIKTSTSVSTLPKKDEKALLYGIKVESQEELNRLLEDYCS